MTEAERIQRACYRFMVDEDLAPLREWWEAQLRSVLPAGPVDPYRLAMKQGDHERLLRIMAGASEHRKQMEKKT